MPTRCFYIVAIKLNLLLALQLGLAAQSWAAEMGEIPRRILVLFDSRTEKSPQQSLARMFIEAPLNVLGQVVYYQDVNESLAVESLLSDQVNGVVTAFPAGTRLSRPLEVIKFLSTALSLGKRVFIFGELGFLHALDGDDGSARVLIEHFLSQLGLRFTGRFLVSGIDYIPGAGSAELQLGRMIPSFSQVPEFNIINSQAQTLLVALPIRSTEESHSHIAPLIVRHPHGIVSLGESAFSQTFLHSQGGEMRSWHMDPFILFEAALDLESMPRADFTTAYGLRIGIAYLAWNGWSDISTVEEYKNANASAAQVIDDKIIGRNKSLKFSLAPYQDKVEAAISSDIENQRIRLLQDSRRVSLAAAPIFENKTPLTRLDPLHPNIAWLAPLASPQLVGEKANSSFAPVFPMATEPYFIYDTGAPEYGFHFAAETIRSSDYPRRLIPVGIGFELGAGASPVRLKAIKSLLAGISGSVFPLSAAEYLELVKGFYTLNFSKCGKACWTVRQRGTLNTIRFNKAKFAGVNYAQSRGVLGARVHGSELFLSLDPAVQDPRIQLITTANSVPHAAVELLESNWSISNLRLERDRCSFDIQGVGDGRVLLRLAPGVGARSYAIKRYETSIPTDSGHDYLATSHSKDGLLLNIKSNFPHLRHTVEFAIEGAE